MQWSYENIYRVSKALFPPHPEILKAVCFRGYKDGVNFLKSRSMIRLFKEFFLENLNNLVTLFKIFYNVHVISHVRKQVLVV